MYEEQKVTACDPKWI